MYRYLGVCLVDLSLLDGESTRPQLTRINYNSAKSYADLLSISVALARCTPLSTKLDRPLYGDLVILDDPFCMRFLPYLMVLLACPTHTLTAQQWLPMAT